MSLYIMADSCGCFLAERNEDCPVVCELQEAVVAGHTGLRTAVMVGEAYISGDEERQKMLFTFHQREPFKMIGQYLHIEPEGSPAQHWLFRKDLYGEFNSSSKKEMLDRMREALNHAETGN